MGVSCLRFGEGKGVVGDGDGEGVVGFKMVARRSTEERIGDVCNRDALKNGEVDCQGPSLGASTASDQTE